MGRMRRAMCPESALWKGAALLRSRSEGGHGRNPHCACRGGVTCTVAGNGGLACGNYLPQVTGDYRLLPRSCAPDVPSPQRGYITYDHPPPTFWDQARAEAHELWCRVLETVAFCGVVAAGIILWDRL